MTLDAATRPSFTIVVATSNPGKIAEIQALLPSDFRAVSLSRFALVMPPETGSTFRENAVAKAQFVASRTGFVAIADDSGLEVDTLGGRPGIYSARFAGESASDDENIDKLLKELEDVADPERSARFTCAIALAIPESVIVTSEGFLPGRIAFHRRGTHGFGYDPILRLPDGRHLAELEPAEKNTISHRAQAMRELLPAFSRIREAAPVPSTGDPEGSEA